MFAVDVRQQSDEPRAVHSPADGVLVFGARSGTLAAQDVAIAAEHHLQGPQILVVDIHRPGRTIATVRAKSAFQLSLQPRFAAPPSGGAAPSVRHHTGLCTFKNENFKNKKPLTISNIPTRWPRAICSRRAQALRALRGSNESQILHNAPPASQCSGQVVFDVSFRHVPAAIPFLRR